MSGSSIRGVNALLSPNLAAFRLGDLRVVPATGMVEGPGGEVRLEPRVMAVLEMLARSHGELVSRAELLAEIWPGGDIYDEALTQCVYQLRQQLTNVGGQEESRNLISTVPKRGYALKGEVELEVAQPVKDETGRQEQRKWPWLAGLALVAVLAATWAVFQWRGSAPPSPSAVAENSIAVLPFLPLVEADREPVLELGMADTLITKLSGIGELVVRPVSSVRRYGDLERDALKAGRQLGVEAVVDGSIHRSGDTFRVAVRLLRVTDGASLWAATINEPFGNIFEVQDEICARIAGALALELGQDDRRELARGGTSNTEAYERYLKGRYHLSRLTPVDLRESVEHFRAAVALDPDYTQAWLGLASVQFRIPIAGEVPPREYFPLARHAAERALELDPNSAEAYAMLGWIAHWYEWDWVASEAHFRHAIELDPNDTESHLGYAHLLSTIGRYDEGLVEARRARELSPNYTLAAALEGGFLMRAGQNEEALRQLEIARGVGENLWLFRINMAAIYRGNGRPDDALAEYEQARILSGGSTWVIANEIAFLRGLGREDEAQRLFDDLLQQSSQRYVPYYDLATAYRAMGDLGTALDLLEQAHEARDPKMVFITHGVWSPLHEDPRFQHLAQSLNLQSAME